MKKIRLSLACGMALLALRGIPVHAQGFIDYRQKLTALEQEMQQLKERQAAELRKLKKDISGIAAPAAVAPDTEMVSRVYALNSKVDRLQGTVAEVQERMPGEELASMSGMLHSMQSVLEQIHEAVIPPPQPEAAAAAASGPVEAAEPAATGKPAALFAFSGEISIDLKTDTHGDVTNTNDNAFTVEAAITDRVTGYVGMVVDVSEGPGSDRFTGLGFDGAGIILTVRDNVSLTIGDVAYQYGIFSLWDDAESMIAPEVCVRGMQLRLASGNMSLNVIAGSRDADRMLDYAAGFTYGIGDAHRVSLYHALGSCQIAAGVPMALGAEYAGPLGGAELKTALALNHDVAAAGAKPSFAGLVELSTPVAGPVSLDVSAYFEDDRGTMLTPVGDMLLFAEPAVALGRQYRLGLGMQYLDPRAADAGDERMQLVPTAYYTPTEAVEFSVFTEFDFSAEDHTMETALGTELNFEF